MTHYIDCEACDRKKAHMKPSVEAITAALKSYYDTAGDWIPKGMDDALEAAYAIDVDPLLAAKDKEIEQLKNAMDFSTSTLSREGRFLLTIKNQGQRIAKLEAENERLRLIKDEINETSI